MDWILKKLIIWMSLTCISSLGFSQKSVQKKQEIDFVNSWIGTAISSDGGLVPMVGPPFAMTNFTPQTRENHICQSSYWYEDSTIFGFLATHQPAVCMGDYGYVSIMPEIDELNVLPDKRRLTFKHADEFVSPYMYRVKMKVNPKKFIKAEMTATERCGILQFTFPASKIAHLLIQAVNIDDTPEPDWDPSFYSKVNRYKSIIAYININKDKNEITGYNPDRQSLDLGPELKNFKGYFIIQFDKPFTEFGIWKNDTIQPGLTEGFGRKRMGAYISFATKNNETYSVKIATSFISLDQARENLNHEIPGWNIYKVEEQTRDAWQKSLEKIKIEGVTDDEKTIFYSSFYHCLLYPRIFSEYGKYYSAFDDKIHVGVSYNDYSLWDTYRAEHPFLIFVEPARVSDMITSMLQMYREGGWLPMWPNPAETNIMIGTHADDVIADAYIKGIRGFDVALAYEAMRKDDFMSTECDVTGNKMLDRQTWSCFEGQAGQAFFHSVGYVPSDFKGESVSRTFDYGVDDYCTAQMAKDLGKNDDYERLMQWSHNYRNLYNKETGFFAPRFFNGEWDPKKMEDLLKGVHGLISLEP